MNHTYHHSLENSQPPSKHTHRWDSRLIEQKVIAPSHHNSVTRTTEDQDYVPLCPYRHHEMATAILNSRHPSPHYGGERVGTSPILMHQNISATMLNFTATHTKHYRITHNRPPTIRNTNGLRTYIMSLDLTSVPNQRIPIVQVQK